MGFFKRIRKRFSFNYWWYWVPGVLMVVLFFIFYSKIHNDLNADMIAYFSVAKHYQDFDFKLAFNSYWSPLICWLMALFPQLKKDPIWVFRTLHLIVAFVVYYQLFFWIRLVVYKAVSRFLLSLILGLLVVELSLSVGAPDFLSLACFLFFLQLLFRFRNAWQHSVLLGASILLCYFSKTFLLPLCISILGLFFLYNHFSLKNKIKLKSLLILSVVLFAGLFIWASCLKLHYGFYTLSSSAGYNNSIYSATPVSLQEPKFEEALFMWEDPYYIKATSVYAESTEFIFDYLKNKFQYNFEITLYYFRFISYMWIAILIFPIIGFFQKKDLQWKLCLLFMTVFLMNWFGYFLVFIMERYLIIGQVALYMAVFGYIEIIGKIIPTKLKFYRIELVLLAIVFISIVKNPIDEIRYGMRIYEKPDKEIIQAKILSDSGLLKGKRIATFQDSKELYDYLSLACFQGDGKYYGEVWTGKSFEEKLKEINEFQLDYVVVNDCDLEQGNCDKKEWLSKYPIVYKDAKMKVKIYLVR